MSLRDIVLLRFPAEAEVTMFHQTRFGGPDSGPLEQGDCWATAVCCLAGLPKAARDVLRDRIVDNTRCSACKGTGRVWYMQGGGHGVGQHGRCDSCGGRGFVKPENWWEITLDFLTERAKPLVGWTIEPPDVGGVAIASGRSPRGEWDHSVLVRLPDGELLWDPHPSGDGLAGPVTDWTGLIVGER